MSKSPFILVPWQNDFMKAVLNAALQDGRLDKAVFIFPHARPARYLERLIREDERIKKPCLMPRCLTVSQLFAEIWAESHSTASPLGNLDRIGLLLDCLRAEQSEHPGLIERIPTDDAKAFFPWGRRLAALFEECFAERRVPDGFIHLEDEVLPFAAAILSRLGSLYHRYINAIESNGRSTPGYMALKALEAVEAGHEPRLLYGRPDIYLCGFYSLSSVENALFKRLWLNHGARVLIHADPALAGGKAHWSCAALGDWQKQWGAGLELKEKSTAADPNINFYAGYDVHSQLAFLRSGIHKQSIESGTELEDTAIILPDTSLLLPVLHHIQADDVNISMGYPLSNTALQRFFDSILALHENARQGFYWKDCIRFLRQPYLKMLGDETDEAGRNHWREFLIKAEQQLRAGRRYVDLAQVMNEALSALEAGENLEKIQQIWESVRYVCLDLWQELASLAGLGEALEKIVNLLFERGEKIWPRFPIDAECLARVASSLIPELKNSSMAHEELPTTTIFAVFRELAQAERVPFDAYPLTVLQIMGLLESRLLYFKNVFIMDATDDLLPGGVQNDPLLPDSLRAELGLPDAYRRQRLTAYYFFRLVQCAENVHIFWQEGVEAQGILDGKKLRSRFVEELIWREEQKLGRLLAPRQNTPSSAPELPPLLADGPFHQIGSRLAPFRQQNRAVTAGPEAQARLKRLLSEPMSATRLNHYMRCPASFYYRELADVAPPKSVNEGEDFAAVGILFHQVLKDYYAKRLGQELPNERLNRAELGAAYKNAMLENLAIQDMPADERIALSLTGGRSLRNYLDNQPAKTIVRALEISVSAPLSTPGGKTWQLYGQLDRIDERMQDDGAPGLVILDYKTGKVKTLPLELWNADGLWKSLESGADPDDHEFFCNLADMVGDVQLPMYLYLAAFGQADASGGLASGLDKLSGVCNAGWVAMRERGQEIFLFPNDLSREARTEIIEDKISLLLEYLLSHLAAAKNFPPRSGQHCEYCDYRDICIVLSR